MDFAVASDAIKALRKNLAPECNVKRSGDWLNKAPMDCCVKSGEVEFGVRVTGKNTELVKIISTIANTNDVGHFEVIIYSITLFLVAVSFDLGVFHHGRVPLQHLRVFEDARVLRRVVCGVNSDRHASCVHFDDGPIVLWQRDKPFCLVWHPSRNFLEWTCCAPTSRASSHRTS